MNRATVLRYFLIPIALMVSLIFPPWNISQVDAAANLILRGDFEITIYEGPSATSGPVTVAGDLILEVGPSGSFTGTLRPSEGQSSVVFGNLEVSNPQSVPVVGQVNGRAYNLLLDLGNDRFISGVGTAQKIIRKRGDDAGFVGGPAIGPERGDRGDWAVFRMQASVPQQL